MTNNVDLLNCLKHLYLFSCPQQWDLFHNLQYICYQLRRKMRKITNNTFKILACNIHFLCDKAKKKKQFNSFYISPSSKFRSADSTPSITRIYIKLQMSSDRNQMSNIKRLCKLNEMVIGIGSCFKVCTVLMQEERSRWRTACMVILLHPCTF